MNLISKKAYAKLNLALSVISRRNDGYHEMDMINKSVALCDDVTVEKTEKGIALDTDMAGADVKNDLTVKAAKAFFETAKITGGAKITVRKNIPVLAGLGGGSADAAAVLLALNELYGSPLDYKKLNAAAASVGADVPFCLVGGTARVRGIGEKITPLPDFPECSILLVRDGSKLSTAQMFCKLDGENARPYDITAASNAVEKGDIDAFCAAAYNSFDILYNNTATKKILLDGGAKLALTTGNGPVLYGLFVDNNKAKACFEALKSKGYECWLC